MKDKKVAIHQPNFFPWMGYFNKIYKSDCFVFLTDVAYPKSGNSMGSWTNRVKVLVNSQPVWIGCQIQRLHGIQLIKDVEFIPCSDWKDKTLRTISLNYQNADNYNQTMKLMDRIMGYSTNKLSEFNMYAIQTICSSLEIDREFVLQPPKETYSKGTELLIDIVQSVGGTSYIAGGGASGYQQDSEFGKNRIELEYQGFVHPIYQQYKHGDEFVEGLSILDCLMNCGFRRTSELIRGG